MIEAKDVIQVARIGADLAICDLINNLYFLKDKGNFPDDFDTLITVIKNSASITRKQIGEYK